MKIVQINAVYGKGSTGSICSEISEKLIDEGHESVVLYASGDSSSRNAIKISNKFYLKFNAFMARVTGKDAGFAPISTRKIIKVIKMISPDVVHLHNLHGNYVNLKKLLRYLAREDIATVITLHDCWYFTGKCTHYTEDGCDKWKQTCEKCPRLKKDIPSWFFDRTKEMWSNKKRCFNLIPRLAVIGVSEWITEEARKSFLSEATIIKRIYNWIDTGIFHPYNKVCISNSSSFEKKFLILCVSGSWTEGTVRYKDLIKLANEIDDSMQIGVVGGVKSSVPLPSNIIEYGYINDTSKLAQLYSYADVYVHLSHEDTFGKVIAEAMACGTPAIVYNSTAYPELIRENTGYVIENGNITEIVKYLELVEYFGKEKYSESCIQFVSKNFEKQMLLNETFKIYSTLYSKGSI